MPEKLGHPSTSVISDVMKDSQELTAAAGAFCEHYLNQRKVWPSDQLGQRIF
jgi:hypothetical protein